MTPVREPGALELMGLGLLGFVALRRGASAKRGAAR